MAQTAYNLRDFETKQPAIRVARPDKKAKPRTRFNLRPIRTAAVSVVFLALIFSLLYTRSEITEMTTAIANKQDEIVELKSEYDYMNFQLESKTSLSSVEEYAVSQLNLAKLDSSQITYVTLQNENRIERAADENPWWQNLKNGFLNVLEYLTP